MFKEEQSHCNTREHRDGESLGLSSGTEPSCKRVCRSQLQTFDIDKCAICQKDKVKKAYGKGGIQNDSRMLLHIDGRDTIAMKIKYHRSCYKNYVHLKQLTKLGKQISQEEDAGTEGYDRAFMTGQNPFRCQHLLKNTLPSLPKKK